MYIKMNYSEILKQLKKLADPKIVDAKRHRGSLAKNSYGIMVKDLRILAKEIGTNHALALKLFNSGIHEAKKLASMIDDPKKVTESQMETWVKKFDAWDICDCCCSSLFVKSPFAYKKIFEWCNRDVLSLDPGGKVRGASFLKGLKSLIGLSKATGKLSISS